MPSNKKVLTEEDCSELMKKKKLQLIELLDAAIHEGVIHKENAQEVRKDFGRDVQAAECAYENYKTLYHEKSLELESLQQAVQIIQNTASAYEVILRPTYSVYGGDKREPSTEFRMMDHICSLLISQSFSFKGEK